MLTTVESGHGGKVVTRLAAVVASWVGPVWFAMVLHSVKRENENEDDCSSYVCVYIYVEVFLK